MRGSSGLERLRDGRFVPGGGPRPQRGSGPAVDRRRGSDVVGARDPGRRSGGPPRLGPVAFEVRRLLPDDLLANLAGPASPLYFGALGRCPTDRHPRSPTPTSLRGRTMAIAF